MAAPPSGAQGTPDGLDGLRESHGIEGLGDDVHRAYLPVAGDLVRLDARGHEHHWHVALRELAQRREGGRAVHPRHHDVEQHEVGRDLGEAGEGLRSGAAGEDGEAAEGFEGHGGDDLDVRIVLHEEDPAQRWSLHACSFIPESSRSGKAAGLIYLKYTAQAYAR